MKILVAPHLFLRKTARPVTVWTPKLQKQLKQMTTLLENSRDPKGMGLAATQVGIDKRFFIVFRHNKPQVFINPKITKSSNKMLSHKYKNQKKRPLEGCLSIPKLWGFVDRPFQISLTFHRLQGASLKTTTQTFKDIRAAAIQHELDHLNGILFTDHILKQNGQLYQETQTGLVPVNP